MPEQLRSRSKSAVGPSSVPRGADLNDAKLASWQRQVFLSLFVGYLFYASGRRGVVVATDGMMKELNFKLEDIGMLSTAFSASYGLSKFVGSIAADIFSARLLFAAGLVAAGIANITMGFSSELWLSKFVWSLNGGLQGLGWPALSAVVLAWYPAASRGRIWSMCTVAGNLGNTIAPVVLSLAATSFGWRAALFLPGGGALLVAVGVLVFLKDSPEAVGLKLDAAAPEKAVGSRKSVWQQLHALFGNHFAEVVSSPHFWTLVLANIVSYLVLKVLSEWSVKLLQDEYKMSKVAASAGLAWFEAGGVFGTLSCGFVSDALGGNRNLTSVVYIGMLLPAILAMWGIASPDISSLGVLLLYSALFVAGVGTNGPKTMCGLSVRESFAAAAGTSGALLGLTGQVGAAAAGWPVAKLVELRGGWSEVLLALAAASAFGAVLFVVLAMKESGNKARARAKAKAKQA